MGAPPQAFADAAPVGFERRGGAVGETDFAAAEQGGAFVNLVKRIGTDDNGFEAV